MSAEGTTTERIEIDLAAPPPRVYKAIATAAGVRSWWTDGEVAEEVGGVSRMGTKGRDHYVRTSLRGLVEDGEGAPGPGAGSRRRAPRPRRGRPS